MVVVGNVCAFLTSPMRSARLLRLQVFIAYAARTVQDLKRLRFLTPDGKWIAPENETATPASLELEDGAILGVRAATSFPFPRASSAWGRVGARMLGWVLG